MATTILIPVLALFCAAPPADPEIVRSGLILDLNAEKGIEVEDGDRVVRWTNQVATSPARDFVPQDEGRREAGSGRPTLTKSASGIGGRSTVVFRRQELVNRDEDAFDHLITGNGYTWFAVISFYEQVVQLEDVNSFLGNLRNGGNYEGIWGNVTDDNRPWIGSRNGLTFGRFDPNNPMVLAPEPLEEGRYHVVGGRMGSGGGEVPIELFVDRSEPVATKPFPVNPKANSSKLAIGQERDATNHPGKESFDGEIARLLIYERPLTDAELRRTIEALKATYALSVGDDPVPRIRPYARNPRYWEYAGKPVLLLGGSKDDNLFQIPDLETHLDEMASVGANFVRNTMSDRPDKGFEVYPYRKSAAGKYDLDEWNEEYWARFERFLRWTGEREIFVQIEVWDRFDYSQENWEAHPYRPANNVNYTPESSGLRDQYPVPAWRDRQPFFHTIPGMPLYVEPLDIVREYQERFVAKLLSHSLPHGHVLYCMDNETSTPPAWGRHWISFIQRAARKAGVSVYCTDMFDDGYEPERSTSCAQAFDDPEVYSFLDISQINSRIFDEAQWEKLRWVRHRVEAHPRPLNCVKIYGDGSTSWGSGTPKDGVERFWRDLFAGWAAVRAHRDGGGIGLQPISKACILAARKVESMVKLWDVEAHQELLSDREPDEAYVVAKPGEEYVVYFTQGGAVGLDLEKHAGEFRLRWVDIGTGEWGEESRVAGGSVVPLEAPSQGPHAAVLIR